MRLSKRTICIHEAAHAVAHYRLGYRMSGERAKIWATEKGGEAIGVVPTVVEHDAVVALAGGVAQKLYTDEGSAEFCDLEYIAKLLAKNRDIKKEDVGELTQRAFKLLSEPSTKRAVLRLAEELESRGELSGAEVERILTPEIQEWELGRRTIRIVHSKQSSGQIGVNDGMPASIAKARGRSFKIIEDEAGKIVDYQDVSIAGYLSTFGNVDRDGETVRPGAFRDSIPRFLKNAPILCDHVNGCSYCVGSFTVVREDQHGLYIEGDLSNGDSEILRQTRAAVAEGHLKTMSMGGTFYYEGNEIVRVELYEGSLTPIPANPLAIVTTK